MSCSKFEKKLARNSEKNKLPKWLFKHIGYKKLAHNLIAVLEILGINNDSRADIYKLWHAKHRCSKAKVLAIYDMNDKNEKKAQGFSMRDQTFTYTVGKTVKVKDYDKGLHNVCSTGIHYFLSEECAYMWGHPPCYGSNHKEWYDNGRIKSEIIYDFTEKLHSKQEWNINGLLIRDKKYNNNGECVGKYLEKNNSYKNGVEYVHEIRGYYINGKKHGLWVNLTNGRTSGESWYKNDALEKDRVFWQKSGKLYSEQHYNNSMLNGMSKICYKNGNVRCCGDYENGCRTGLWKFYYKNGNVRCCGDYENGRRQGLWNFYYKNGELKMQCTYNNGKKNGEMIKYYKNGFIKSIKTYDDDLLNGSYTKYHKNGCLSVLGTFRRDIKSGPWEYYDENYGYQYKRIFKSQQSSRIDPFENELF